MDKKTQLALLRGISQVQLFQTLTRQALKEQVFGEEASAQLPEQRTCVWLSQWLIELIIKLEQDELIDLYSEILSTAAYKNLAPSQLSDLLNSKYNKQLSESDIAVFSHFWTSEQAKVHQHLIAQSNFTSALSERKGGLKWRIDQLTNPDDLSEMTETVAIVELNTTTQKKVVFEVDKSTLFQVVDQLQEIQNRINTLSM